MVFALWADDVQAADGVSHYLLWAPNVDGSLPDDKALSVRGADPHAVLTLRVEQRAGEYWASWGGRPNGGDRPGPVRS